MKKYMNPILLPIFIDSCSAATSAQINTGSVKECLEGLTTKLYLALKFQRFDTLDDLKDQAKWNAAILIKDIVPLFDVYEVASDNTEATKYETGNFVYTTKKEIKKLVAESYLSICSHRALKSYENSDYTQVYEVTENKEILAVWDDDGIKVKGQDLSNFDVHIRERPTNDKPAFSMITATFRDFEEFEEKGIIVKPTWDPNMLNGIFELQLKILTASATEITFQALSSCGNNYYNELSDTDMKLLDAAGVVQAITTMTNANNVYTIEGAALVTGTLATDGVATIDSNNVESKPVVVTII